MPGAGEGLCEFGASDRNPLVDDRRADGGVGAHRPGQVQAAPQLTEAQRTRWDTTLTVALATHHQIATQSRRLTHGKPLTRCKIVNAYDATIAPICKGKSNCPTQFGRKPGIIAEPAT